MKLYFKRFKGFILPVLRNPALRPVEIWAMRAAIAYVAVKLGIDATKL